MIAVAAVLDLVVLWMGFMFRAGRLRRLLILYRDPRLGTTYRNIPLIAPLAALGLLPSIVLALLLTGGTRLTELGRPAEGVIALVVLSFLFGFVGFAVVVSSGPPARFVPRWLREDDERVGYEAPPASGPLRIVRLIGYGSVVVGAACVLGAIVLIIRP